VGRPGLQLCETIFNQKLGAKKQEYCKIDYPLFLLQKIQLGEVRTMQQQSTSTQRGIAE
jgi:hypothetical protein